jgi:hypothetical protein
VHLLWQRQPMGRRLVAPALAVALCVLAACSAAPTASNGAGSSSASSSSSTTVPTATPTLSLTNTPAGNSTFYTAKVPGPNCDKGGAQWVLGDTTTQTACQADGLAVTKQSKGIGIIAFEAPGGSLPAHFSVAFHVVLQNLPYGCVGIPLDATHTMFYWPQVCTDGAVYISQADAPDTAINQVNLPHEFTITASFDGALIRFFINGTQVGSQPATAFTENQFTGILFNNDNSAPGTAVFSNFVVTILP